VIINTYGLVRATRFGQRCKKEGDKNRENKPKGGGYETNVRSLSKRQKRYGGGRRAVSKNPWADRIVGRLVGAAGGFSEEAERKQAAIRKANLSPKTGGSEGPSRRKTERI